MSKKLIISFLSSVPSFFLRSPITLLPVFELGSTPLSFVNLLGAIYNNNTKSDESLISYDWFPSKAKQIIENYDFPVFPEDFAYYLEHIPGSYYRIGCFDGSATDVHTATFDIDDACIPTAIKVLDKAIEIYFGASIR